MPHFDPNPAVYWLPIYALCWGLLWLSIQKRIDQRLFLAIAFACLFLVRLPSIVFDNEINPDESQMITQALTLRHDPVYFRSVDGTTGGPLDSYFLILPSFFGLPFDYITAHLTAFGLVAVCLWLLFRTAKRWFGEEVARLALLPFIFTYGLTQNGDFLHYNSELIALVLLSWTTYLYATLFDQRQPSWARIGLIGFLLGMVPFGKLQAIPMAAVVGLFVGLAILIRQNLSVQAKIGRILLLGVCAALFPILVVFLTFINGVYDDFVTFYLVGNFQYGGGTNQWQGLLRLPIFFQKGSEFDWLVKFAMIVWIVGLVMAFRRNVKLTIESIQLGGFIGLMLIATLFAITRTGSEYVHYLYFLTGPLFFLLAYGWQQIRVGEGINRWIGLGATAIFLGLFGLTTVKKYLQKIPTNPYPSEWQNGWVIQQSPVAKVIRQYARPGEKLAVWGWRCDYYVQTQMPQGVAENHTIRSTYTNPMLNAYQNRYVRDFVRSSPPVFVDAVGSQNLWMNDRKTQGHELIKPLAAFVQTHYTYKGLVDDTRIYVRNDRINGLSLANKP